MNRVLFVLLLLTNLVRANPLSGMVVTGINPSRGNALGHGDPLGGVEISVDGTEFRTVSSANGYFHFEDLPEGEYRLKAHKNGFPDADLKVRVSGVVSRCQILMNPEAASYFGDTATLPGDLFVAYSKKPPNVNDMESSPFKNIWQMAIAAGASIRVQPEDLPHQPTGWGQAYLMNPICGLENCLMSFPFANPSRSGFLPTPVRPYWMCFDRSGTFLFVGAEGNLVQILDARQNYRLLRNLPMKGAVTDLRLSADGRYVTVCVMGARPGVVLIDPVQHVEAGFVPTPSSPWSACLVGPRVFACMGDSRRGQLLALDAETAQVVGSCPVAHCPTDVQATPDGKLLAVACSGNACVSLVDSLQVKEIGRVQVDVQPQKLAISPDGKRCLVPSRQNNTVSLIDLASAQVVNVVEVGKAPVGICYSLDGRHAYVACRDSGVIMVLDARNAQVLHTTIPLPHAVPTGVCVHP
ncbi:carboxypeptidase regulatory-like domain-containing protein [bacterium]|nr:carboxypeptidase regulatory-like domain-containing protein [bacterium]